MLETGHGPDLALVAYTHGLGQPTTGQRHASVRANGQLDRIQRRDQRPRVVVFPRTRATCSTRRQERGTAFCSPRARVGCVGVR